MTKNTEDEQRTRIQDIRQRKWCDTGRTTERQGVLRRQRERQTSAPDNRRG